MKISKYIFTTGFLSLFSISAFSQGPFGYYNDAVRFSQTTFGGTARFQGIAGATTALGADMGTLNSNPAGLGFYRKSDVSISPGLNFAGTRTNMLNTETRDNKVSFNIANIGIVFSGAKDDIVPGKYRGGSFGISMTRTNNFQNQFSYSGFNKANSFGQYVAESARGYSVGEVADQDLNALTDIVGLAYNAYLIDPINCGEDADKNPIQCPGNPWHSNMSDNIVKQKEIVATKGNQSQWDIAYGGNIDDKIYLGASLGIATIKYESSKVFTETNTQTSDTIDSYSLHDNLTLRGTGINFKVGAIIKPADWIRIGLTGQTPTYYSIRTTYEYKIKMNLNADFVNEFGIDDSFQSFSTLPGTYNYNLTTPARAKAGIALFAGKAGFISGDVEVVGYSGARLKGTDPAELDADNDVIKNLYKTTFNFNLGAEARLGDYRLRAGYARLGDPYRHGVVDDLDRTINTFTFGAGLKSEGFYADIAFVNTFYKSNYYSYHLNSGKEPMAIVNNRNTSLVITIGTSF
ncbi:OmpP1/FadL family transporter [Sporocytophaga myxococcoides]|uniref:OmpP1/FadL family transporter n=1 Tax=Sporocytophaga myxococcoides TaxID=153721 RepID=UPI00042236FC|nr:hypothetical protein [Sporocytophaga myxococcoides]